MPAVPITNREQYIKAIEVLDRVGGTWSGVGDEERFLLVSERQYKALVDASVTDPKDVGKAARWQEPDSQRDTSTKKNGKDTRRGKSARKTAKP